MNEKVSRTKAHLFYDYGMQVRVEGIHDRSKTLILSPNKNFNREIKSARAELGCKMFNYFVQS